MVAKKIQQEIPSLKELVKESWILFKQSIGQLVVLNVLWIFVGFILTFIGTLYGLLRVMNWMNEKYKGTVGNNLLDVLPRVFNELPEIIILFVLGFIFLFCIQALLGIGSLLVLENKEQKESKSVIAIFKESFKYLIPIFCIGIINFFLVMGSMFFFIIPGIIIAILLSFTHYEIVIAKKSVKEAILESIRIITQNFSTLLSRYILYWLAYVAIIVVIPMIVRISTQQENSGLEFLFSIFNIFIGIFGMVFAFIVYQRARIVTDEKKPVSLRWIIIPTVLGYVFIAYIISLLITYLPAQMNKNSNKLMQEVMKETR